MLGRLGEKLRTILFINPDGKKQLHRCKQRRKVLKWILRKYYVD